MRTLILLRHAKAAQADPGQSDEMRRLTGRGRREAAQAGAALLAEFTPEIALVSSSTRTRETSAEAFKDHGVPIEFSPQLYLASARTLWDAFAQSSASPVVLIAHNPGLAELAGHLVRSASGNSARARGLGEDFPTSAWAAFEIRGEGYEASSARFISAWRPSRD